MTSYPFQQVDVFTHEPFYGNPLAVIHDAHSLDEQTLQNIARWMNLSETVFLLPPTLEQADYRVRIFTANGTELPFAGHPTLGACHAWLQNGGKPRTPGKVVQQVADLLTELKQIPHQCWAFHAPPMTSCTMADADLSLICQALGIAPKQVKAAQVLDNGPHFMALFLDTAQTVLQIQPEFSCLAQARLNVGVIGPYAEKFTPQQPATSGSNTHCNAFTPDYEVRFFAPALGVNEDPITGSLNAALAQWLITNQHLPQRYTVSQGTAIGRHEILYIEQDEKENVWVGGHAITCINGQIDI